MYIKMMYIMYRITAGDYTYIGSTKDFKQRKSAHKLNCKTKELKIYQMIREAGGWDNCEMVPIEEYECENGTQARMREEHWRREYNANMNSIRAHRTEEELIEQRKAYCEANTEQKKINNKAYYEANIEKIKKNKQAKHTCECGGKYTMGDARRHEKSKKHLDYLAKTLSTDTL